MKKILFAILALALVATVATSCCPNSCEANTVPEPGPAPTTMYLVAEGPDFKVYFSQVSGRNVYVITRTGGGVGISAN